ncbi:iron ABC transporter permease, partial [Vibrio campbellii]
AEFRQYAFNSLYVSVVAAVIATLVAIVVNFNYRLKANTSNVAAIRLSSMGYAVPGTVLAIGILVPVIALDHMVNDFARWMEWGRP